MSCVVAWPSSNPLQTLVQVLSLGLADGGSSEQPVDTASRTAGGSRSSLIPSHPREPIEMTRGAEPTKDEEGAVRLPVASARRAPIVGGRLRSALVRIEQDRSEPLPDAQRRRGH